MKSATIVALALLLAACSQVTIEHAGGAVVAKGSGSALLNPKTIIDRTHKAAEYACTKKGSVVAYVSKVDQSLPANPLQVASDFPLSGILGDAKDAAEDGKALLSLFGSHSYSITQPCPTGQSGQAETAD